MTKYNMYIFDGDVVIGKFKTTTDNMDLIFTEFGEKIVRDGFNQGFNVATQIDMYNVFINEIHKQKRHCQKIRHSDFYIYLSCVLALYKFNQETCDFLFLKCKKKNKKKCNNINV